MLLALALLLMPVDTQSAACSRTLSTLAAAHDCYRPLLVFADSADDPKLKQQIAEFCTHPQELLDRDIAVAIILPEKAHRPDDLPFTRLSFQDEASARRRFHADAAGFAVVLVGKDSGEKMHRTAVLKVADLNQIIDAMPMRQREMQQRKP